MVVAMTFLLLFLSFCLPFFPSLPSLLQLREWVGPCRYHVTQSTQPSSPREPSKRTRATLTVTAASSMRHTNTDTCEHILKQSKYQSTVQ